MQFSYLLLQKKIFLVSYFSEEFTEKGIPQELLD